MTAMTAVVLAVGVVIIVVLTVRGRAVSRAAIRRCQGMLRRKRHDRDVQLLGRLPSPDRDPLDLPRCEQCDSVFDDLESLRRHAETHR